MNMSNFPNNIHFKYMEKQCSTCSQLTRITMHQYYDSLEAKIIGLTRESIPRFSTFVNKQYIFPMAWEDTIDEKICLCVLCSHKCARRFWHNFRLNDDSSDEDFEESGHKRMRLD